MNLVGIGNRHPGEKTSLAGHRNPCPGEKTDLVEIGNLRSDDIQASDPTRQINPHRWPMTARSLILVAGETIAHLQHNSVDPNEKKEPV